MLNTSMIIQTLIMYLALIMSFGLEGLMTSPDVPLHIGYKCGEESNSQVFIDQVSTTITLCEFEFDSLKKHYFIS